jgi:hypothetical protein
VSPSQDPTVQASARAAAIAAVAWSGDGGPGWLLAPPFVLHGTVVLALPYADRGAALGLATAGHATLVLADGREAGPRWTPLVVTAATEVTEDPEGRTLVDDLLPQAVAKHMPSRRRLDSALLRREHWWYVPRLLVTLRPTDDGTPVDPLGPADGLLAIDRGTVAPSIHPVPDAATADSAVTVDVDAPLGTPGTLLTYDVEVPTFEPARWQLGYGRVEGGRWQARSSSRHGWPGRGRATLVARIREERRLARACREGLRAAGRL